VVAVVVVEEQTGYVVLTTKGRQLGSSADQRRA
jgi:hypothetical protein